MMFIAAEFAPQEDVFHKAGKVDSDFILLLRQLVIVTLSKSKALSVKEIKDAIDKTGVLTKPFTLEHTQRMIDRLVLSRKVSQYQDENVSLSTFYLTFFPHLFILFHTLSHFTPSSLQSII